MNKKAFITGITGQDGAWLAGLLLAKGYEVYGGVRRTSTKNYWRLDVLGIRDEINFVEFDLMEYSNMLSTIRDIQPDEFYNLAAQSFVGTSFDQPIYTGEIDGMAVAKILDIIKTVSPHTRFYQASTSEMFGGTEFSEGEKLSEKSYFHPRSPYGVAKLYAHWMTANYRESYNLFACAGILFNHESELRGEEFVTRKITKHVAAHLYTEGKAGILYLGNLDARRDWGYAPEYVEGMWLMLQREIPSDYVLATGESYSIKQFVESVYRQAGITIRWEGVGINTLGYDVNNSVNGPLIAVDPKFYRPAEVNVLIGDSQKAFLELGWQSRTGLDMLAKTMLDFDFELLTGGNN